MAENASNAMINRQPGETPSRVVPLSEHDELEIANGYADVRGWEVRDFKGRSVGYVYDLLVDETRVWYLDVLLDSELAANEADPRVLIPIERAGLDGSAESVILRGIDAADIRGLVPYAHRGLGPEHDEPSAGPSAQPSVSDPQVRVAEQSTQSAVGTEVVFATISVRSEDVAVEQGNATAAAAQEMRSDRSRRPHQYAPPGEYSLSRAMRDAVHAARRREKRMSRVLDDRLDVLVRRPGGNGGARPSISARESVGELFKRLSGDASHLIQQEMALAKLELREAGTTLARDVARFGIAAAVALPGVLALTAFLVIGLGDALDNYWLAALIVGVILMAIGGLLARNALTDIRRRGLTPQATVATVREDSAWAAREMRELKQHVRS